MSKIVIDSKEVGEYFENWNIYRLAGTMTAIFRHKENSLCIVKTILKFIWKTESSGLSKEIFLNKKIMQNCYSQRNDLEMASLYVWW